MNSLNISSITDWLVMKFCVNLSRFNASTNYIVKSYCSWKHREILHWGRASAGSHIRTLNLTTTLAGIQVASLRIFHYARGPVTTVILPYSRERVPCHYNTTVFHTPRPTNPYSVHVHSHSPPPQSTLRVVTVCSISTIHHWDIEPKSKLVSTAFKSDL